MRFFLVLGVVAGLTTVACGGDDSKPAGDTTAADTAGTIAPAPAATDAKETTPKSDAVATSTSATEPKAATTEKAETKGGDDGAADPAAPPAEAPKGDDDDDDGANGDANPLTCFSDCVSAACQDDPNTCATSFKSCNAKCLGGDK